ncbi:hypothetical protein HYE42_03195 [Mycoplasmopsis bovis]|nr:hypothetical protein [Mycoplasmopsis bovis]QQH20468.1 hypothetical protein HYE42_03195 [Mycoplasmopsis bovis]
MLSNKSKSKSPIDLDVSDKLDFQFFAYKPVPSSEAISLFCHDFKNLHFKIFRYSKACFVFSSIELQCSYSEDNSSKLKSLYLSTLVDE